MHTPVEAPATFAELGIEPALLKGLDRAEIHVPTEIQVEMIRPILAGRDVAGQARTGTGKTLAFALPVVQKLAERDEIQALFLVPTRELAIQVHEEVKRAARYTKHRSVALYGGQRITTQVRALQKKPHVAIGTPGRVMDLMRRGLLPPKPIRVVVLDEVDRMLDIGFREDIRRILRTIGERDQTIFASATLDDEIKRLIERHTSDPVWINVSRDQLTATHVDQAYVTCDKQSKFQALLALLEQEKPGLAIIFTNTKGAARRIAKRLHDRGFKAAEIHGDLLQRKRERVMENFRRQHVHLLIATDLASRGIDVDDVTHIINFDIPLDAEVYVHRIGRTARMGKSGKAFTLVTRDEGKQLTAIEMLTNQVVPCVEIQGYRPAPPPPPPEPAEPVAAGTEDTTPARPRTLGGNFKPRRRRRRL